MKDEKRNDAKRLKARIAELEALIGKWEDAKDSESRWMIFLLKEAVEMGRIQLSHSGQLRSSD